MSGGSRKRHLASIWAPFPTKVNKTMTKEADIFFVFVCSHFQCRNRKKFCCYWSCTEFLYCFSLLDDDVSSKLGQKIKNKFWKYFLFVFFLAGVRDVYTSASTQLKGLSAFTWRKWILTTTINTRTPSTPFHLEVSWFYVSNSCGSDENLSFWFFC